MATSTRATQLLANSGVQFTLHSYGYDPAADRIGIQAAAALGESPSKVLKTLMTVVDGKPVCVILPSDREIALKKLAAAMNGKTASMMPPADAERIAGYRVGGISPFAQRRKCPTVFEAEALDHELVFVNAGQRGLQVRLDPHAAVKILQALVVPIVA